MRKSNQTELPEVLMNPHRSMVLDPSNLQGDFNTKNFYYENGLKTISEGTLAVILNFSGVQRKLELKKPKSIYTPDWGSQMCMIEFFLNQLKSLGNLALQEYGKNYSGSREPILVLVQLNEIFADEVENILTNERYFGYKGVVTFKTVRELC